MSSDSPPKKTSRAAQPRPPSLANCWWLHSRCRSSLFNCKVKISPLFASCGVTVWTCWSVQTSFLLYFVERSQFGQNIEISRAACRNFGLNQSFERENSALYTAHISHV